MSYATLDTEGPPADLYERIGFDPALEAAAYRLAAEMDLDGCRTALGRLADRLDLDVAGPRQREIGLLLLDVLLQVARRLHRDSAADGAYLRLRASLVEQFAAYDDPEDARQAFLPALNRLLVSLRRGRSGTHPLVERARAYIDDNYHRRISLSAVAAHLHSSSNYLSRVFKREAGRTLTSYIHGVRLEHAMRLLATGERSISEIAYLVGYQNYRDFYRNFVKYKKASPRQIQRRLGPGRAETGED